MTELVEKSYQSVNFPRDRLSISNRSSVGSRNSDKSVVVQIKNEIPPEAMERDAWGGQLEFILACIGSGIGLGNVWRFPYLLFRSGGGAFIIPFVIMLILIGIPIFMMEISIGQFCSLSGLNVFKFSPIFKGVGYSMIFVDLIIALYYCVIISWCLYYFFCSFTSKLPWEDCGNIWNTLYCTNSEEFKNITNLNLTYVMREGFNISKVELKTPSEEFFYRKVLQISDGIDDGGRIVWQLALCMLIAWLIVFLVLLKGIASLGKVVYFTSTFPFLLLTIMLVKGVMLEGSLVGIQFYIVPDWSKLADPKVWSDAATQIFYSLSACAGALIGMSSYNKFNNNTIRDSFLVPIINVLTSIYAGFVIFSVLGYMANMKGVDVAKVAADGPGLVFVVYPEALSLMPLAPLWSILFFLMMSILGFSSLFSMSEAFFTAFADEFPTVLRASRTRTYIVRGVGIICFYFISLPMVTNSGFYLFSLLDLYTGGFPLLVLAVLELGVLSYVYGAKRFGNDVAMMVGDQKILIKMFRISWSIVSPLVILLCIIATGMCYEPPTLFNETYVFPPWAESLGWLVVAFIMIFTPGYALFYLAKDLYQLFKEGVIPEKDWGPYCDKDRTGNYKPLRNPPPASSLESTNSSFESDSHYREHAYSGGVEKSHDVIPALNGVMVKRRNEDGVKSDNRNVRDTGVSNINGLDNKGFNESPKEYLGKVEYF